MVYARHIQCAIKCRDIICGAVKLSPALDQALGHGRLVPTHAEVPVKFHVIAVNGVIAYVKISAEVRRAGHDIVLAIPVLEIPCKGERATNAVLDVAHFKPGNRAPRIPDRISNLHVLPNEGDAIGIPTYARPP